MLYFRSSSRCFLSLMVALIKLEYRSYSVTERYLQWSQHDLCDIRRTQTNSCTQHRFGFHIVVCLFVQYTRVSQPDCCFHPWL